MSKKIISIMLMLALSASTSGKVFAAPDTSDALKQTQDNKKELQIKVQELDKKINDTLKQIDSSKKDMNKMAKDIKSTQVKIEDLKSKSSGQQELFKKRIRAMYTSGTDSYIEVILSSENISDFISKVNTISTVMAFDKKIINKLKEERTVIENKKAELDSENNKLAALKESNEKTLASLSKEIKDEKELLSKETEKEKQLMAAESAKAVAYNSNVTMESGTLSRGGASYSQVMVMDATAYSGDGITASGAATKRNAGGYSTIAVDPRVIPLGARVFVEGYGYAVAEDTGGAIIGNRIDVFEPTEAEAESWGRRSVKVYILNN